MPPFRIGRGMAITFTFTLLEATPPYYRVRISDHKLEKIVSLKGVRLTIGEIGTWCGLAPDDSPLVLRDVGTQEIYALDLQLP